MTATSVIASAPPVIASVARQSIPAPVIASVARQSIPAPVIASAARQSIPAPVIASEARQSRARIRSHGWPRFARHDENFARDDESAVIASVARQSMDRRVVPPRDDEASA